MKILAYGLIGVIGAFSLLPLAIAIPPNAESIIRKEMGEKCNTESLATIPEIVKEMQDFGANGPILVVPANLVETAVVAIHTSSEGHEGFYLIACGWDPLRIQVNPNFRPIQLTGDFTQEVHSVFYYRF